MKTTTCRLGLALFLAAALSGETFAADTLGPRQALGPGQSLDAGAFRLVMQNDCNLVVYQGTGVLWNSETNGRGQGCRAVMQEDGNLVVVDARGQPLWNAETNGQAGARVTLQQDGSLVIRRGDQVVWATIGVATGVPMARPQQRDARAQNNPPNSAASVRPDNRRRADAENVRPIPASPSQPADRRERSYSGESGGFRDELPSSRQSGPYAQRGSGDGGYRAPAGRGDGEGGGSGYGNQGRRDEQSGYSAQQSPRRAADRLEVGDWLDGRGAERLSSPNRQYQLRMQSDCNLVLYDRDSPTWESRTKNAGRRCRALLQPDGQLVIEADRRVVWSSRVQAPGGRPSLRLQDNGDVAAYVGRRPYWATDTANSRSGQGGYRSAPR